MSNKHDANVRKSTLVNFQIGLIASLLFTYFMFEVYTAEPIANHVPPITIDNEPSYVWDGNFIEYQEPKKKVVAEKRTKPVVNPNDFEIVDDKAAINEAKEEFKAVQPTESYPIDPSEIIDAPEDVPVEAVPFTKIEWVPVFPGCETLETNKERAACFSDKVKRIVSRKFNTELGQKYGLTGVQRIYAQFEVDVDGVIKNIRVRAAHPKLEKEAKRVIDLFPKKMTPGMQRGVPVKVKYQLPIVFKIQD
ncbi:energy transducer TonB [Aquimarina sp. AU474]|uniref:energy transducer TonB n=1 Tax=Aquimarina sp. AU474 TaxID=2108529 RepID=UPI0013581191|nr:energy transducer TonB [Aquimarina sp. AU474]